MKLITKELKKTIPPLYAQENLKEPIVHVKLFTPWTYWTWYILEMDEEGLCYGLVDGHEKELGYFHLDELAEVVGPAGLKVERDIHFQPKPLKDIKETT